MAGSNAITICDERNAARVVTTVHTHRIPRIGELIWCRGEAWRVDDIFHPSSESELGGIYTAYALAHRADPIWVDTLPDAVKVDS